MKIFLSAFLNNNFGDDLMIRLLCRSFPEHIFELENPAKDLLPQFSDIENLRLSPYSTKQMSRVNPCPYDLFLKIGGSIFIIMRRGSLKRRFFEWKSVERIRKNGCRIATIGCNTGPFYLKAAEWVASGELRQNDLVTVRDKKSLSFLQKHAKKVHCEYYPDMLLSLGIKPFTGQRRGMCVSTFGMKGKETPGYFEKMAEAIQLFYDKTGEKTTLLCFENDEETDIHAAKRIKEIAGDCIDKTIIHKGDGSDIIEAVSRSRLIISARFHSAIIAVRCNTPLVPVVYSDKTENALSDYGYRGARYRMDRIEETPAHRLIAAEGFYPEECFEQAKGHLEALGRLIDSMENGTA
ncbi:MAG: polysaccharide pyruvyl transferase family protein [Clostridia bacterium]|nr:polysaccharide pyruvyl transferase family protein [Clostridia bacterium]